MNRIKLIYTLLIAAIIPLLTACSSDDLANNSDDSTQQQGEKVTVRLRISPAGSTPTMRASWQDPNAATDESEMMHVWVVVGVNSDNNVVGIWACNPEGDGQEEDDEISELVDEFNKNEEYRFYSFANMSPTIVMDLLGITSPSSATDGTILASTFTNTEKNIIKKIAFANGAEVVYDTAKSKTVKTMDNVFNVNGENSFGSKGIPMSNIQVLTFSDSNPKDLIVVRMLAKIELWLYNDKGSDLEINSITLTDITAENQDINLFPTYSATGNNVDNMSSLHGDIRPADDFKPTKTDVEITPSTQGVIVSPTPSTSSDTWTISTANNYVENTDGYPNKENAVKITFYVNESNEPQGEGFPSTPSTQSTQEYQQFYHYLLKININGEKELRYTLIGDKGNTAKDDNMWNYIARNDYRIIPIVLDDYKLDMIPYDFPAIGVLPASVKEEDGIYTINFHDYGHFHLVPKVTKYSSPSVVVPYSKTAKGDTYWNLGVDDESSQLLSGVLTTRGVWGSWIDASKDKNYVNNEISTSNDTKYSDFNKIAFYRTGYNPTTIEDGDEVGGEPVWYLNDLNAEETPRWSPNANATDYPPFIFGYIADPFPNGTQTDKLEEDRKVYHEFTINLHKANATPATRQMTYRLYMILDTKQMLYRGDGSGSTNGAPRVRHPHCLH